jgi:hypothetical protein
MTYSSKERRAHAAVFENIKQFLFALRPTKTAVGNRKGRGGSRGGGGVAVATSNAVLSVLAAAFSNNLADVGLQSFLLNSFGLQSRHARKACPLREKVITLHCLSCCLFCCPFHPHNIYTVYVFCIASRQSAMRSGSLFVDACMQMQYHPRLLNSFGNTVTQVRQAMRTTTTSTWYIHSVSHVITHPPSVFTFYDSICWLNNRYVFFPQSLLLQQLLCLQERHPMDITAHGLPPGSIAIMCELRLELTMSTQPHFASQHMVCASER